MVPIRAGVHASRERVIEWAGVSPWDELEALLER
jgi:hypothetical protein